MTASREYKVDLEVFEGPLDLLLYLIRREEVDIYDIPIETITTQYMQYLNLMRMLDLNIAGEFIVMAATLMMIKSRMLLPVDERPEQDDEEEEDPRWDLVRQLVEYKQFKDAARRLQEREIEQENVFGPGVREPGVEAEDSGLALQNVSLFDLISAFDEVLKRAKEEDIGEILADRFSVEDKIDAILATVGRSGRIAFRALFSSRASRHEVICTFLALLELIRLRQVEATQDTPLGEILIAGIDGPGGG